MREAREDRLAHDAVVECAPTQLEPAFRTTLVQLVIRREGENGCPPLRRTVGHDVDRPHRHAVDQDRTDPLPDREQADDRADGQGGVSGTLPIETPRDRRAHVVEISQDASRPPALVGTLDDDSQRFGELGDVSRLTTAPDVGIVDLVELIAREDPEGLQHRVPGRPAGPFVWDDHRLRHQARDRVAHLPRIDDIVADDRARRVGVERAGEDPQPVEHGSLGGREQLV